MSANKKNDFFICNKRKSLYYITTITKSTGVIIRTHSYKTIILEIAVLSLCVYNEKRVPYVYFKKFIQEH